MQILQKQLAVAAQIRPLRRIVQAACYIIGYFLVIDALQKFDPLEIIQLADDISIFQQEHIGKIVELDMGLLLIKAVNNKTEICAQSTHHIDAAIPNGASNEPVSFHLRQAFKWHFRAGHIPLLCFLYQYSYGCFLVTALTYLIQMMFNDQIPINLSEP